MKLLTQAATATKLSISPTTLRGIIQRGQFVTPVQVAPRRIAFVEAEVDAWLASRPRGALTAPQTSRERSQRAPNPQPIAAAQVNVGGI